MFCELSFGYNPDREEEAGGVGGDGEGDGTGGGVGGGGGEAGKRLPV